MVSIANSGLSSVDYYNRGYEDGKCEMAGVDGLGHYARGVADERQRIVELIEDASTRIDRDPHDTCLHDGLDVALGLIRSDPA